MDEFDDYLMHYGVKGMKWGQRKARPTSGRRRVSSSKKLKIKNGIKRGMSTLRSYAKQRKLKKAEAEVAKKMKTNSKSKALNNVSDDDLAKRTKRLQAENQYLDALAQNRQKKMTKGDRAKAAIKQSLAKAGKQAMDQVLTNAVNKAIKKAIGGEEKKESKIDLSSLSKNASELSDKQLSDALKRIKWEKSYSDYIKSLEERPQGKHYEKEEKHFA